MKHLNFRSVALIGFAAATALAGPAFANHPQPEDRWAGTAVHTDTADRVIRIDPTSRWVNVTRYETVKFVVVASSGREEGFAWRFNGVDGVFELSKLAPAGLLTRSIKAYVAPDPRDIQ